MRILLTVILLILILFSTDKVFLQKRDFQIEKDWFYVISLIGSLAVLIKFYM